MLDLNTEGSLCARNGSRVAEDTSRSLRLYYYKHPNMLSSCKIPWIPSSVPAAICIVFPLNRALCSTTIWSCELFDPLSWKDRHKFSSVIALPTSSYSACKYFKKAELVCSLRRLGITVYHKKRKQNLLSSHNKEESKPFLLSLQSVCVLAVGHCRAYLNGE